MTAFGNTAIGNDFSHQAGGSPAGSSTEKWNCSTWRPVLVVEISNEIILSVKRNQFDNTSQLKYAITIIE
jgi:hypothetical protein